MKILFGEEQPTAGEIYVYGQKVSITSPKQAIKMGIGMVHQHFMLVPSLTVVENIILGMEPKKGISIDETYAIKEVEQLGKKYNLYVNPNEKVENLTVGQKQKVEILKALFRGSKILILDEPTAALDAIAESEVYEKFRELGKEKTCIYISHRLASTQFMDRIILLKDGKIQESGTHKELMAQNRMYARLYEIQSRYYREEEQQ